MTEAEKIAVKILVLLAKQKDIIDRCIALTNEAQTELRHAQEELHGR
jgi:hypothetical protein